MKAILRQVRISPKKINLIASLVRRKNVNEAIHILKFTPKKGAQILKKVVESAKANAENNFKQIPETLYIKEIIVTEGTVYKRSNPISKGRSHPILKRTAHITVKIEQQVPEVKKEAEKEVKVKKVAKKEIEKPETTEEEPVIFK